MKRKDLEVGMAIEDRSYGGTMYVMDTRPWRSNMGYDAETDRVRTFYELCDHGTGVAVAQEGEKGGQTFYLPAVVRLNQVQPHGIRQAEWEERERDINERAEARERRYQADRARRRYLVNLLEEVIFTKLGVRSSDSPAYRVCVSAVRDYLNGLPLDDLEALGRKMAADLAS